MSEDRTESSERLLDAELARLSRTGWQIVSRTETAVQVKKPKRFHTAGLLLFVVLPFFGGLLIWSYLYGVALIGFIIVVLDYLLKKERLEYITVEQLKEGKRIKA